MDDLRQSVQNARFEQKDPLLIYKFESFELFKQMLARVNSEIVSFLLKANLPVQQNPQVQQTNDVQHTDLSNTQVSRSALPEFMTSNQNSTGEALPTGGERKVQQPVKVEKTVGRNEPCPCGSGKKYKQCHGKAV
jgi:preprotein translocase subunit SecA